MWVVSIFFFPKCQTTPLRLRLLFVPLLVMIGPAVMTALPDATGGESRLSTSSRLRRRPQICQSHHQIPILIEVTRHVVTNGAWWFLHLLAWAWCSRLPGKAWWRSAKTLLTSSGVYVWQNGKPRRKNVPSGSFHSRKRSSVGLCSNCVKTHRY